MQAISQTSSEQNQTKQGRDPRNPRWWLLAVVALFALALGAVGGALLTDGGGGEPDVIRADGGEPTAASKRWPESLRSTVPVGRQPMANGPPVS